MKLLIKFPTRGRPKQFMSTLKLYSELLSGKHEVIILVVIDNDDETMNGPSIRRELDEIPGVIVEPGTHKTKIEAINDPIMTNMLQWDVVLLASDDMIPQVKGYDDIICSRMAEHFPRLDGVLWFNDGYTEERLDSLCILGRKYYDSFGYIYHPDYKSLWCDNEFMDVFKMNGRFIYFGDCIIKHEHWANNSDIPKDNRAVETESFYHEDEATYKRRKKNNFSRKLFSILICTVPDRAEFYNSMMSNLTGQIARGGFAGSVEILTEIDEWGITIGEKRNRLMDRAFGEYIAYVDDDDYVSGDYVEKIVAAIRTGAPDCVGIWGEVYMDTKPKRSYKPFVHSLEYKELGEHFEFFYRPPNHLNPIKRSIAVDYPFKEISHGEDTEYALAIVKAGAIKTEVMAEGCLYSYIPSWMRKRGLVTGIEKPL